MVAEPSGGVSVSVPLTKPLDEILSITVAIARDAGALVREGFGSVTRVDFKGAVNPVTQVDQDAEDFILARLRAAFPDDSILAEESGQSGDATGIPHWFVDPIDGTNNFAHGVPHFCVSIALRSEDKVVVGTVYDPLKDEMFAAYRGGGVTLNGRSVRVSTVDRLADAFLATGFPYTRRVAAFNNVQLLDHFLRRSQGVRRMGSAALDMAYVACGRFDGFWEPQLSPWDVSAGALLVEEAGGRMSDFSGETSRLLTGEEVIASNSRIHAEMLTVVRDGSAAPHPDFPALGS
jgi:myo-inositol-1(or 4)-monophosphatase